MLRRLVRLAQPLQRSSERVVRLKGRRLEDDRASQRGLCPSEPARREMNLTDRRQRLTIVETEQRRHQQYDERLVIAAGADVREPEILVPMRIVRYQAHATREYADHALVVPVIPVRELRDAPIEVHSASDS